MSSGWGRVDDPAPAELPANCDVAVVGLGGTGLTCLLRLAESGLRVVGIDRAGIAAGAAGGNGGFLLAGLAAFYDVAVDRYGRPDARRWYQQTLDGLDLVFADDEVGARRTGSLRIAADDQEVEDCERHAAALRVDGFPVEAYEGPEGSGLLLPTDGVFDPVRRAAVLADRAERAGAVLVTNRAVVGFTGDSVTVDGGRTLIARHVVVAVDGDLEHLAPELAGDVRTVQLQMLSTAPLDRVVCARPVYRRQGLDYYQQASDRRLFVGGGRDVGGAREWLAAGQSPTPTAVVQAHLDTLTSAIAGGPTPVTHRWAAAVAMSTSGLPIARQADSGAWLIGAYNGTGNVIGPLLGSAVAERIARGRSAALDAWL